MYGSNIAGLPNLWPVRQSLPSDDLSWGAPEYSVSCLLITNVNRIQMITVHKFYLFFPCSQARPALVVSDSGSGLMRQALGFSD